MPNGHQHQHPTPPENAPQQRPAQHAHDASPAQVLDLDAEVLAEHLATVTAWLPVQTAPAEILDLGAGTGAGSFALLRQFPDARLTAVDSSAAHLDQLRAKADTADLGDRVRVVQADLDLAAWPDLGTPDLVWASASLHHLADPDRALGRVHDLLAPGGLVAVVELAGLPRFLPATATDERPGLEERCHAALQQRQGEQMPHRGADWGPKLTAAGFGHHDRLTVEVDVAGTLDNAVGPYALAVLQRLRVAAAHALPVEDLAALDQLLDPTSPHSVLRRDDLAARTTRTVWAARRARDDTPVTATTAGRTAERAPAGWFSAAVEAANCDRVLGHERHGIDTLLAGGDATTTG